MKVVKENTGKYVYKLDKESILKQDINHKKPGNSSQNNIKEKEE